MSALGCPANLYRPNTIHFMEHHILPRMYFPLTSTDQAIPIIAKIKTIIIQRILEGCKLVPLSKKYWIPCTELFWLYSTEVVFTTSCHPFLDFFSFSSSSVVETFYSIIQQFHNLMLKFL